MNKARMQKYLKIITVYENSWTDIDLAKENQK